MVGLKPDTVNQPASFSALTQLVGHLACKTIPEMTYNV